MKTFLAIFALAGGLFVAGAIQPASAAMPIPELGTEYTAPVTEAAWQCGPYSCYWRPGYRGYVPPHARYWGPPTRPDCYWKYKARKNKWKLKC
ncbi:hypothetical protein [Methyloligella solikamskensis]|uniref:Uncharacterized protein n=1 Tax=Methyloligella solikamskensis TaxID=1177756 RepID=A0ABW3J7R1_9HYPH